MDNQETFDPETRKAIATELVRWFRWNAQQPGRFYRTFHPKETGGMKHRITARCDNGHESSIIVDGFSKEAVEIHAGLLDGTSDMFKSKPRDNPIPGSKLGRCEICGAWYKCTVTEEGEGGIPCGDPTHPDGGEML